MHHVRSTRPVGGTDVGRAGAGPDHEPGRHDHVDVDVTVERRQQIEQHSGQPVALPHWLGGSSGPPPRPSWSSIPITDTVPARRLARAGSAAPMASSACTRRRRRSAASAPAVGSAMARAPSPRTRRGEHRPRRDARGPQSGPESRAARRGGDEAEVPVVLDARDHRDLLVALVQQVVHGGAHRSGVVDPDARHARQPRPERHERHVQRPQRKRVPPPNGTTALQLPRPRGGRMRRRRVVRDARWQSSTMQNAAPASAARHGAGEEPPRDEGRDDTDGRRAACAAGRVREAL